MNPFRQIRFVLVEPKHEGNIGAVARVIHNLGFTRLALVNPRAEIGVEARKLAYRSRHMLRNVRVCHSLRDAVADAGLVIGTTRRKGSRRGFQVTPREMADMAVPLARLNTIALVFGSEDLGLSTHDLGLCQWVVRIPTPSKSDSFNLAQAVAIVGYELMVALGDSQFSPLAVAKSREGLFRRLEDLLREIEFFKESDPNRMMMKIRRIFHRSGLNENEVRILQGIVSQVRKKLPRAAPKPRRAGRSLKRR